MVKRVLLVAFHFPPVRGSSGVQRTLKFATYLRESGWEPVVLTVHPRAYAQTGDDQLPEIPSDMVVERAFALDTSRHLAFGGRHFAFLARPDRYIPWFFGGLWSGVRLIGQFRPELIWVTYPVATALVIGNWLRRLSGLPLVTDFRDTMTEPGYPEDPSLRRVFQRIEKKTVRGSDKVVFTTPGARQMYAERYPDLDRGRLVTIPNGYDEDNFRSVLGSSEKEEGERNPREPFTLVHSGILYPKERDPIPFFKALERLKTKGVVGSGSLRVILRATGHDSHFREILEKKDIGDMVELASALPYREALEEMVNADGLLILQAANCNRQIPAKLYEYLRAQRPILALTDAQGDTAGTLQEMGIDTIWPLDDPGAIEQGLTEFLRALSEGTAPLAGLSEVKKLARRKRASELAVLFDELAGS